MNRAKSLHISKNGMYTCYNVALRTEYKPAIQNTNINTVSTWTLKYLSMISSGSLARLWIEQNHHRFWQKRMYVCMYMIQCWLRGLRRGIYNDFGSGLTDMLPYYYAYVRGFRGWFMSKRRWLLDDKFISERDLGVFFKGYLTCFSWIRSFDLPGWHKNDVLIFTKLP